MTSLELNKLHVNAQKLINQGQFKQAHETCLAILKLAPRHADCHFLLGIIAANLGQMTKAIGLIDLATKLNNNNAEYFCFLAKCQSSVNRSQEAHSAMTRAIQISSGDALVNDTLGVVASRLGDHKLAITLFKKAISIRPDNASFYYNLAASQKFLGDFQQAEASYEKAISLQADYFQAHSALAELMQVTKENNHIERLLALKKRCQNNVNAQLHICHALAKEWECLGQYIPALETLQQCNAAKKQQLKYSIDTDQRLFSTLKSCFESWPNLTQLTGSSSKKPIFIVGMPRSGTTLVDRIISSHSDVISAGELQNFGVELKKLTLTRSRQVLDEETILAAKKIDFQQLAQRYLESTKPLSEQSPYFIDKMPLNFLYIGFIKKAFPQAKIIIMRRNAMDTCLSNFRTLFAVNFSYYNYSYDLMDTARYFGLFSELMDYWKSLFKEQLLEVVYEDLVEKPEEQIRRILDYCELSWQPACLNFQDNEQAVSTASSVQVRKPMNTDSIDRWKRYGNKLDELRDYLDSKHLL